MILDFGDEMEESVRTPARSGAVSVIQTVSIRYRMVELRGVEGKRKYAKWPSALGDLDCHGIYDVAMKHGMEVICCSKPDMCCWNSVGLYGTPSQMQSVEAEWNRHGNKTDRRKPKGAWPVNLDRPRSRWASREIEAAKENKISNRGGTVKARTKGGRTVVLPKGYRLLTGRELPKKSDIAWNEGARQFEPIDYEDVEKVGKKRFKERAYLLARATNLD